MKAQHSGTIKAKLMRIGLGDLTCSYQPQITAAANAAGIPASLALAVASWESTCNPGATNVNPATPSTPSTTDYGLFQINTVNLQSLGLNPSTALDPTANINAGISLLASLYNQYGGNVTQTLEAYNAGPGTVASGNIPTATATKYVPGVTALQSQWNALLGTSDSTDTSGYASDLSPSEISFLQGTSDTVPDDTSNDGSTDLTPYYIAGGLALLAGYLLLG